jgi:hypothetical protein
MDVDAAAQPQIRIPIIELTLCFLGITTPDEKGRSVGVISHLQSEWRLEGEPLHLAAII